MTVGKDGYISSEDIAPFRDAEEQALIHERIESLIQVTHELTEKVRGLEKGMVIAMQSLEVFNELFTELSSKRTADDQKETDE